MEGKGGMEQVLLTGILGMSWAGMSANGTNEQTREVRDTCWSPPIPTDTAVVYTLTGDTMCPPLHILLGPARILCGLGEQTSQGWIVKAYR